MGKSAQSVLCLKQGLGLRVKLALGLDTGHFGTFSRDIDRTGTQLDVARAKIAAAFDYAPYARVGLASEGSFGPHPYMPFLALGRELVLLVDRERGLELTGHFSGPETNYGHAVVSDIEGAIAFADRLKFPEHGLIVMGCVDEKPAPSLSLIKDVIDHAGLEKAVGHVVAKCGAAFVEGDMRATAIRPGCGPSSARRTTSFAGFAVNARPAHIQALTLPIVFLVFLAKGAGCQRM